VSIKNVIIYDKTPKFGSLKGFWKKLLTPSSTLEMKLAVLRKAVTYTI